MALIVYTNTDKGITSHEVPFINCKSEVFENIGMVLDDDLRKKYDNTRFCPDLEKLGDRYKVQGAYTNRTERIGFFVAINICNPDHFEC